MIESYLNKKKLLKKDLVRFFGVISVIIIFVTGYFLRAYFSIVSPLPFSPYELFKLEVSEFFFSLVLPSDFFSYKDINYPLSYLARYIFDPLIGDFYIIYVFLGLVIFFLGRLVGQSYLAGFFAFALFAVSSENLLQYTSYITPAGLSYGFFWVGLLFLYKYSLIKKDFYLVLLFFVGVLIILSYHTAGLVLAIFMGVFFIRHIFFDKELDRKYALVTLALGGAYTIWIVFFDRSQFNLLQHIISLTPLMVILTIFLGGLILIMLKLSVGFLAKLPKKVVEYFPIIALAVSTFFIFWPWDVFTPLLSLGAKKYYASSTTLNNYISQTLITHVYILLTYIDLRKNQHSDKEFFTKWLIALGVVLVALAITDFYSRILDYSFPLAFVSFGYYWAHNKRFRKIMVVATLVILTISQIRIYQDSFSLRRYYKTEEIVSAQKVLNLLSTEGRFYSDARTAALFDSLGFSKIRFGDSSDQAHSAAFYEYLNLRTLLAMINSKPDIYLILTDSMKHIVYSTNFQTKPLEQEVFDFYHDNFDEVYNDGVMMVYKLYDNTSPID